MGPRYGDFPFNEWARFCGPDFQHRAARAARHATRRARQARRGRVFERGDLKYMVLRLLAEQPMHGYQVMQRLEEEAGGFYTASPGSVYPVLQMLQDEGYVTSEEVDGKRVYTITEEGRAFLERHSDRVEDVADRVSDFGDLFGGRGMGELTSSFVKLARLSFEKAMEAAGDGDAVRSLREILDRAARDVEAWKRPERRASS